MESYELHTADGERIGEVVGRAGDAVLVEHGLLRKSRHAVPLTFVEVDDEARVVRTTLSKQMIEESPRVEDGDVDERAVAAYYGLAGGDDAPLTAGYGALNPDDPAETAQADALRGGVEPAEQERAETRKRLDPGEGPLDRSSSPGITGGDRFRDAG